MCVRHAEYKDFSHYLLQAKSTLFEVLACFIKMSTDDTAKTKMTGDNPGMTRAALNRLDRTGEDILVVKLGNEKLIADNDRLKLENDNLKRKHLEKAAELLRLYDIINDNGIEIIEGHEKIADLRDVRRELMALCDRQDDTITELTVQVEYLHQQIDHYKGKKRAVPTGSYDPFACKKSKTNDNDSNPSDEPSEFGF